MAQVGCGSPSLAGVARETRLPVGSARRTQDAEEVHGGGVWTMQWSRKVLSRALALFGGGERGLLRSWRGCLD